MTQVYSIEEFQISVEHSTFIIYQSKGSPINIITFVGNNIFLHFQCYSIHAAKNKRIHETQKKQMCRIKCRDYSHMGNKLVFDKSKPTGIGQNIMDACISLCSFKLNTLSSSFISLSLFLSLCACIHMCTCVHYISLYTYFPKSSEGSMKPSWHFSVKFFNMHNPRTETFFLLLFYRHSTITTLRKININSTISSNMSSMYKFLILSPKCSLLLYF